MMANQFTGIFSRKSAKALTAILKLTKEGFLNSSEIANSLADLALGEWMDEARTANLSWSERYISCLKSTPSTGQSAAEVYADLSEKNALFFNLMENGGRSWSINDALKGGPAYARNRALGKNYVTVPFRQRTPSKVQASSQFAGVMPGNVYAKIRRGEAIDRAHKALAGLKRYDDEDNGNQGRYFTFRRWTEKSDWKDHPGFAKTPVFPIVEQKVNALIENFITNFIESYIKSAKKAAK